MIERVQIRNFRILRMLEIDQLSRVNLIAGLNNSGKTSLLEALFLLSGAGNPELAMNVNIMRGLEPSIGLSAVGMTPAVSQTQWKEFFSGLDLDSPIEISGLHASLGELALDIRSERPQTTEISLDGGLMVNLPGERALTFRYDGPAGVHAEGFIRPKGQGVEISQPDVKVPFNSVILSSRIGNAREDAVRLGTLRKQKRGDLLLEALRVVEPNLQSIEDSSASGEPMIWGDVGLSELIPLSVMGEGMTRIARLVLAISSVPGGLVLVDEIENGLHHTLLPKVWQVIDTAARQFNAQVFATTHSLECIGAAQGLLESDSFRLHRLEATDSAVRCVTYYPDVIGAAMLHGLEVR